MFFPLLWGEGLNKTPSGVTHVWGRGLAPNWNRTSSLDALPQFFAWVDATETPAWMSQEVSKWLVNGL